MKYKKLTTYNSLSVCRTSSQDHKLLNIYSEPRTRNLDAGGGHEGVNSGWWVSSVLIITVRGWEISSQSVTCFCLQLTINLGSSPDPPTSHCSVPSLSRVSNSYPVLLLLYRSNKLYSREVKMFQEYNHHPHLQPRYWRT